MAVSKAVHFSGICGEGMSCLALAYSQLGVDVKGSDTSKSCYFDELIKNNIEVSLSQKADHLQNIDLLIYSTALPDENVEICEARAKQIPRLSRNQALGALFGQFDRSVAVVGAHGKTSTTGLVAYLLSKNNQYPTVLLGGQCRALNNSNFARGDLSLLVAEVTETDGSLIPATPLITTMVRLDHDHYDQYEHLDDVIRMFERFCDQEKSGSMIIKNLDDPYQENIKPSHKKIVTFGCRTGAYFQILNVRDVGGRSNFEIKHNGKLYPCISPFYGDHFVENCTAAIATCYALGVEVGDSVKYLSDYQGIKYRSDIFTTFNGNIVIIDNAHHPYALGKNYQKIKQTYPAKEIVTIFKPHHHFCFKEFASELQKSSRVILVDSNHGSKSPSQEMKKSINEVDCLVIAEKDDVSQYIRERNAVVFVAGAKSSEVNLGKLTKNECCYSNAGRVE